VVEHLPSKCEALSSNTSAKRKKKDRESQCHFADQDSLRELHSGPKVTSEAEVNGEVACQHGARTGSGKKTR
jgi:hypothetical protein